MKLSEYVKEYRKNHSLSLRQMAEKCQCSYQYLSKLENNEIETPQLLMLMKLAEGMNMTVHELLETVDDMTIYTRTYHAEKHYGLQPSAKLAKDKHKENEIETAYANADEKTKRAVRILLGLDE